MESTPRRKNILLADDDPEVRAVIAEYLESRHCRVRQAENGIDALRELGKDAPDVLIIDLMMPRLGGLTALRLVAGSYPRPGSSSSPERAIPPCSVRRWRRGLTTSC